MSATPPVTRRAGIIAAGRGERLRRNGGALKPLVAVAGRPLVARVLASIAEVGPSEVVLIINEESTAVRDTIARGDWPFDVRWIVETTPSSMHSFLRVVETLARDGHRGPFLVSTVDTVAPPGAYRRFAAAAAAIDADIVLAVNRPGGDEKPLLVRVDDDGLVQHLGAGVSDDGSGRVFATAGFYMVRAGILAEADAARAEGLTALRLFLGRLLEAGFSVAAVQVPDSVDVDHPEDVGVAEAFLRSTHA